MAVPFISPVENIDELIEVLILIFLSRRHIGRIVDNELQSRIEDLVKLLMEDFERQAPLVNADRRMRQTIMVLVREELQSLRTASTLRTRRRSTSSESSSESSCWEDKLGDLGATQDCKQVGLALRSELDESATLKDRVAAVRTERASTSSSSPSTSASTSRSPWRLVRGSLGSVWRAVPFLCVVGWHLFQTYNC